MPSPTNTIQIPVGAAQDRLIAIERVLEKLASEYDGGWVTFESKGSDRVVQVAFDDPNFTLNIPHAEAGGLVPKLQESGFAIPTSWTVQQDKKKSFFSSGFLTVEVEKQAMKELADSIQRFGRDFLQWPESQGISATFEQG